MARERKLIKKKKKVEERAKREERTRHLETAQEENTNWKNSETDTWRREANDSSTERTFISRCSTDFSHICWS